MSAAPTPTGEWISQARFDHHLGTAGFDHDFGVLWGPHQNQRLSLRIAPGTALGVLYVYDPPTSPGGSATAASASTHSPMRSANGSWRRCSTPRSRRARSASWGSSLERLAAGR